MIIVAANKNASLLCSMRKRIKVGLSRYVGLLFLNCTVYLFLILSYGYVFTRKMANREIVVCSVFILLNRHCLNQLIKVITVILFHYKLPGVWNVICFDKAKCRLFALVKIKNSTVHRAKE